MADQVVGAEVEDPMAVSDSVRAKSWPMVAEVHDVRWTLRMYGVGQLVCCRAGDEVNDMRNRMKEVVAGKRAHAVVEFQTLVCLFERV